MCIALAGRPSEGLEIFERAKIDLGESRWYGPELCRIRGELALSSGEGLAAGRQYFQRAFELANKQASLSWSLRAATSLAIAERSTGQKEAARHILRATHAKFRDDLESRDLRLAKQVLAVSHMHDGAANSMQ